MKRLILLGFLMAFLGSVQAQNLFVTSTSPANGAVDVDQDSIEITFNKKIELNDSTFSEGAPIPFLFFPFDSVEVSGVRLSEDTLSLIIDVDLADSTDFTFIMLGIKAEDGSKLEAPYVTRFTTNTTAGEFVINGMIEEDDMIKLKASSVADHLEGLAVILTEEGIDFGFEFEDEGSEEPEENDELKASHIAFVNPETGEYSIPGVREGEFFAVGFDIFTIEEETDGFPELYFHDADEDFNLDTVKVNATTAPTDTLNNIDLRRLEFNPFTFQTAVQSTANLGFGSDIKLLAGQVDIPLTFQDMQQPKATLKGLPFSVEMDDHENPFFDPENGKSIIWSSFFYNTNSDEIYLVGVTPFGAQIIDTLTAEDAEIPVPLNTINPLPETYIDSDSAAQIAYQNGGMEFIQEHENADFAHVEILAAHEYWRYPLDNTPSAPTFWKVRYEANSFDFEFKAQNENDDFGFEQDSLIFYIDISSGDILFVEGNEVEGGPGFNVVSSAPADGDFAVSNLMDVAITFDVPLRVDPHEDFFESGLEILAFPFDSIEVDDVRLADGGRTIVFSAEHTPDTDFTWIVSKATNVGGGKLNGPYVFNYTTAGAIGPQTVSGTVSSSGDVSTKIVESESDSIMIALFTSNPFIENDDDDFEDSANKTDHEDEGDGPDFTIAVATLADATDGTYTLEGVRDGEYFPLALNLIKDGFGDETPSAIGIYDPEGDGSLNSITVTGSSLTGIDITFKPFAPITAEQAFSIASATASALDEDFEPYFMFTEEELSEYDDFGDDGHEEDEQKKMLFGKLKIEDEFENKEPTGKGEAWGVLFYNSTSETAIAMSVNPFGVGTTDTVDAQEFIDELELPEEVEISDFTALPTTFFDSDEALGVAELNGGANFREGSNGRLVINYVAIDVPQLLPEGVTADGAVWAVIYEKDEFNEITFEPVYKEEIYFIDFEDGTFLGMTEGGDDPFTTGAGRDSADVLATNIYADNELFIINAQAIIDRDPELDTLGMDSKSKVVLQNEDSPALAGLFFFVDYRYYSATAEEETSIFVDSRLEAQFFEDEFSYLPENVSYEDMEAIPEDIIDSDSAVAVADDAGGADFIAGLESNFDLVRLEISVQAGNRFWEYPEEVDSSTVTWNVIYNRVSREQTSGDYEFENASFFIDAETGEVLAENIQTSNEDETSTDIPTETSLGQNYPNPFNPSTTIPFHLTKAADVEITIYNMLGQRVAQLANGKYTAGSHTVNWNASALASGMYIYRLKAGSVLKTKKLMLIK